MTAEGPTSGLLRGLAIGDALLTAEEAEAATRKDMLAASAALMELGYEALPVSSSFMRTLAERRRPRRSTSGESTS